ncbi:MAG: DUF1127 domain-containing protein [Sneathiella sp.]
MISFTKKELESIALLNPVKAITKSAPMDVLIARAHRERSAFISGLVVKGFSKVATAYKTRRQNAIAMTQLHGMSNRELSDIGIARCDIEHAILGDTVNEKTPKVTFKAFVALLAVKYEAWRQQRQGYAQLMAMDSRQLSDIGLTRGDIMAAVEGKVSVLANDNIVAANANSGRWAS